MKVLNPKIHPPTAQLKPRRLVIHDHAREDPYFWLNERDDPDVVAYLQAENQYTEAVLESTDALQQALIAEMRGRIKEEDTTAPYKHGDYYYYDRFVTGKEYPVYCRKLGPDGSKEVLLDVNRLAEAHEYFDVGGFEISPDHELAAFAVDTVGRRFFDLSILHLTTGRFLDYRIPNVANNFVWASDSKTLLYTKQDAHSLRWNQVYRYELGGQHTLVYEESDEAYDLSLDISLSEKFIYLESQSTLTTEVRFLPANAPSATPQVFLPRCQGHEYFVTDGVDVFYVLSNRDAENFKLVQVPLNDTSPEQWSTVVPYQPDVLLEDVEVFEKYLVLAEKRHGRVQLRIINRNNGESYYIDFRDDIFTAESGDNYEYTSEIFRFDYQSMTMPESVYDYHMQNRIKILIQRDQVMGDFRPEYYESKYLQAPAQDGSRIPISLVYRKDLMQPGGNPTLQYGYGAYGIAMEPEFDSDLLSLLDRGFVFAIAHIRGGSELGRAWYHAGRQLHKKNSFTDFIDCSHYLIERGLTLRDQLYAGGGSAGGLLMGSIINMASDLYRGVYTRVPFVDVITTMLDEDIPLTTGEYDEWGNPNDKTFYDYILSYSPYDNVDAKDYPHLLVTTGLYDSQVQYWEPAKWVAKLRALKTDDNLLLLKTDMQAGHSGKTGRFHSLKDTALTFAFLIALSGGSGELRKISAPP